MTFPYARAGALVAIALGTAHAGTGTREGQALRRFVPPPWPAGPCTILGTGQSSTVEVAALLNGALIHCADYDDTHQTSVVHPSSAVLPAALAMAEAHDRTVGELLHAYGRGAEALIRVAGAAPGAFHAHGFHATAVAGPVGAAVAAGLLAGESSATIEAAVGIAATYGGGTFEYINSGGNAKVVYPGLAARGGCEAVALARAGLRPPAHAVDGPYGLLAAHTGVVASAELAGDEWQFVDTAVKSYPCCYFSQVFLDALAAVRSTVDWRTVERIECHGPKQMLAPIMEPREWRIAPTDPYDAKFALPFQLAALLVHGTIGVDTFRAETLRDKDITTVAGRVHAVYTDELGDYPATMPGRVVVEPGGVTTELRASLGAYPWALTDEFVGARLTRDLGDRAASLRASLADLDAPVACLFR